MYSSYFNIGRLWVLVICLRELVMMAVESLGGTRNNWAGVFGTLHKTLTLVMINLGGLPGGGGRGVLDKV